MSLKPIHGSIPSRTIKSLSSVSIVLDVFLQCVTKSVLEVAVLVVKTEFLSNMAVASMLQTLDLSAEAKILIDSSETEFQDLLARWTEIDKKVPSAIVMPATEDDIVKTVSNKGQR